MFKLERIEEVKREILNNLGIFNLEFIRNLVVTLILPPGVYYNDRTVVPIRDYPIQVLSVCVCVCVIVRMCAQ